MKNKFLRIALTLALVIALPILLVSTKATPAFAGCGGTIPTSWNSNFGTYFGANVAGHFTCDSNNVYYYSLDSAGGFANSPWTLTTDQGPGYYYSTYNGHSQGEITFWYNQKFHNTQNGSNFCFYPRAHGFYNNSPAPFGEDGDSNIGNCSF